MMREAQHAENEEHSSSSPEAGLLSSPPHASTSGGGAALGDGMGDEAGTSGPPSSSSEITATTPVNSLFTFLHRDIEAKGTRLLLPFLENEDRLQLSECCQALLPYRYTLSTVSLEYPKPSPPDHEPSPQTLAGVARLLMDQHDPGLQELVVPSNGPPLLPVLQTIQQRGRGAMSHLLILNLYESVMDSGDGEVLGEAIAQGTFPHLEKFILAVEAFLGDAMGVVPIMEGLESGGCRHLKKLTADSIGMGPQGGRALARALASGNLSCLEELWLYVIEGIGDQAMAEVIGGLKQCPRLWHVVAHRVEMGEQSCLALLEGLREGCWMSLRLLDVSHNKDLFTRERAFDLAEVLERESGSQCPQLELLAVCDCGISGVGAARLIGAIVGWACPRLREIDLCVWWLLTHEQEWEWYDSLRARGVLVHFYEYSSVPATFT